MGAGMTETCTNVYIECGSRTTSLRALIPGAGAETTVGELRGVTGGGAAHLVRGRTALLDDAQTLGSVGIKFDGTPQSIRAPARGRGGGRA